MRKFIIVLICLFFVKLSYSLNPNESNSILLLASNDNNKSELAISDNYQQFKFQIVNLETKEYSNLANLKRRKKQDNLMLYVAGGLALATVTLILTNNPDNFTSNSASSVNLGIAVGGTLASGMIVAKYFIDKKR